VGRSQPTQAKSNNSYALRMLLPLNFKYTAFFLMRKLLDEKLYLAVILTKYYSVSCSMQIKGQAITLIILAPLVHRIVIFQHKP